MKPPFPYYGGKTSLAERIASLLPAHEHYVEPFCGSLSVLLAKPRSRRETVNDLHGDLVNFWRVLREHPDQLEHSCRLTPHARAEYRAAYEPTDDPIERARRVWVRLSQSRGARLTDTGWRYFAKPVSALPMVDYLRAYRDRLPPAADRLMGVSLECRTALEVISDYGKHEGVLIYADPPYLESERNSAAYAHEMGSPAEHRALAEALHGCRATVVLSGYASALYDQELYPDWHRFEIPTLTTQGQGDRKDRNRTEVLWSNRPLAGGRIDHAESALFAMAAEDEKPA